METDTLYGDPDLARNIRAFIPEITQIEYSVLETQEWKYGTLCHNMSELPGWTFLGQGWSRMAYLGPDGLVYKVSKAGQAGENCCITESEFYREHGKTYAEAGVFLAQAYWHEAEKVLTMEFCEKAEDPEFDDYERVRTAGSKSKAYIGDLHSDNFYRDRSGRLVVVDYAG